MKTTAICTLLLLTGAYCPAQDTALTLYNQNFGVVRERIQLALKKGENRIAFSEITAHAEPDSVILRDPSGKSALRILEQNYRADPVSDTLLLHHFEGQEIEFLSGTNIIRGRIVRSGYMPHYSAMNRYGNQYAMNQHSRGANSQPIIEVDGRLRFSLPGQPLFPSLADDSILNPAFHWLLHSEKKGKISAELCYVSGGMSWEADYNIVAPEKGHTVELIGWVTLDNQSGRTFKDAKIKLMAGDVEKIHDEGSARMMLKTPKLSMVESAFTPPVSEKSFDEYHLYELNRTTTLRDRETKQVEFLRADNVESKNIYIYDGALIDDNRHRGWNYDSIRRDREYGTQSNPKIWVMREFRNTKENGLGIPLPKGRTRFYRRDSDGQIEFTGENILDHTPKNETVRIFTGNAFDLVGERKRTDYLIDTSRNQLDETFEIKVRNRKEDEPVEIRVVEHLYRSLTWTITEQSHEHIRMDEKTVEFRVALAPGEEKIITYKVHYTW